MNTVNQIVSYEYEGGLQFFAAPLLCLSTQRSYWEDFSWLDIYCNIYCDIYHGIVYKKKEGNRYDDCKGF